MSRLHCFVVAVGFIAYTRAGAPHVDRAANSPSAPAKFAWEKLTANVGFPGSYNFPVHVAPDGRMVALHPEGTWVSADGLTWKKSALPWSGTSSAYLSHIQHAGATWALGTIDGNYKRFTIDPVVRRTTDYESWQVVGRSPTLPRLVFYASASFSGAMWILGGYNGKQDTAEVWRSTDGVEWRQVTRAAPWSPREGAKAVVFRNRLYLIGGGRLNGPLSNDVWSSGDGTQWIRETARINADGSGGSPVVYQDRLWMIGANRNGGFSSAILVTDDGRTWRPESAPWPPRGAVAVWTAGDSLFMTGGKYSTVKHGETVFIYYNDVWRLRPVD